MDDSTFEISTSDSYVEWADLQNGQLVVHRTSRGPAGDDETLVRWDLDVLLNLLTWATEGEDVIARFSGPMAHQIREHSKDLGMTPEMFVWHATKVFTEVGGAQ